MATINVSTLNNKEEEVVHMVELRGLDVICLCETRFRGSSGRVMHHDYMLINSGEDDSRHHVELVLEPKLTK